MTRTRARLSVQRGGSKSSSSLQRAEMIILLCNTIAAGVMNSVSTFWHGVKVDRPPEVTPVRRACAYVERRSGLLDVAYRRANLRHEPLTFDVLDRHTGMLTFSMSFS